MREQSTLALARALQFHAEESGCHAGVLCDAVRELQWCMPPLLALNGDEIVEASLLQPMEGEHGTSPMPEEEATLLGDIKSNIHSDIKPDVKAPHVPALLEIQEQAIAPNASLSSLSFPSPLPSPKTKKPRSRTTGADAIGAAQWICFYLEDNYRVPEWWREF